MTESELQNVIRALSSSSKGERLKGAHRLRFEIFHDYRVHPFEPEEMTMIVEHAAKTEDRELRSELLRGISYATINPEFESIDVTSLVELLRRYVDGEVQLDEELGPLIRIFEGTPPEQFRHLVMPLVERLSDYDKSLIADDLVSLKWFWEERPLVEHEIVEIVRRQPGLTIPQLVATSEFPENEVLAALYGMELKDVVSLLREQQIDGRPLRKEVTVHWRFYGKLDQIRVYPGDNTGEPSRCQQQT